MSKETSSGLNDSDSTSRKVDAFARYTAYTSKDIIDTPKVEVPAPDSERPLRILALPGQANKFDIVELYNREENDQPPQSDSEESSEESKAKKKKKLAESSEKPFREEALPDRTAPTFRPLRLKSVLQPQAPEAAKAEAETDATQIQTPTPNGQPVRQEAHTAAHDTFGDLPPIENHNQREHPVRNSDIYAVDPVHGFKPPQEAVRMSPVDAEESHRPAVVTRPEVFVFPEQHADNADARTENDSEDGSEVSEASDSQPYYAASMGASHNAAPQYNAAYIPPQPPNQPGMSGNTPPPPPHGGSHGGLTGGGGNVPPFNPNTYALPGMSGSNPNVAPNMMPVVVEQAVPTTVKAKDGFARLMAGVAGAGAFLGYKANKNKIKSVEKATTTQFKDLRSDQERAAIDQRMQNENVQQQMSSMRERFASNSAVATERPFGVPRAEQPSVVRPDSRLRPPSVHPEAKLATPGTQPELPQELAGQNGRVELQPQQRVEHSTWHNFVVEKGKVVPNAIQYGEGYRQELRQEVMSDRLGDARLVVAAGLAGQQIQQDARASSARQSLSSGLTSPTLPSGQPTHADPQHLLPDNNHKESSGLAFWIMLIIIVGAFFAAAFI